MNYLQSRGLRLFHDIDIWHRAYNNSKLAIARARLQGSCAKIVFLASVSRAPWNSGGFLQTKAATLDMYLSTLPRDPADAAALGEAMDFDAGAIAGYSDAPTQDVHSALAKKMAATALDMRTFAYTGPGVDMKRFFSLTYQFPDLDREWTVNQHLTKWHFLQLGQWSITSDDPASASTVGPGAPPATVAIADIAADPGAATVQAERRQEQAEADAVRAGPMVAAAAQEVASAAAEVKRAELSDLRRQCKNSLQVCARVLEEREVQLDGRMICEMQMLYRVDTEYSAKQHLEPDKAIVWRATRAVDAGAKLAVQFARKLADAAFLSRLSLTMAPANLPDEELWADELATASRLATYVIENIAVHCWSESYWCGVMPYSFAGLFHPAKGTACACLAALRKDWRVICEAEDIVFAPVPGPVQPADIPRPLHAIAEGAEDGEHILNTLLDEQGAADLEEMAAE